MISKTPVVSSPLPPHRIDTAQAGRRAAGGLGTVPGRALATLYLLLLQHPVDRHGRCRSCRRPGALLGGRWRRCRVHGEARLWLHQPAGFLRAQLARELDLDLVPSVPCGVDDVRAALRPYPFV